MLEFKLGCYTYSLTDQEILSPLGISKMWKSRKILLHPIFKDITWKKSPYSPSYGRRSTLGAYGRWTDFLRIIEVLLWCSVPNSAKECSGRWYYQRICTSSIHSLLTIALRPSNCDVASRMDASNLEHMYLCSFDIAEFHILLWRGQEWTLTYTSMGGSWSVDLVGSVVSYMWWRWRGCSW